MAERNRDSRRGKRKTERGAEEREGKSNARCPQIFNCEGAAKRKVFGRRKHGRRGTNHGLPSETMLAWYDPIQSAAFSPPAASHLCPRLTLVYVYLMYT